MLTIASFSLVAKTIKQITQKNSRLDASKESLKDVAAYKFKKNISVYSASRKIAFQKSQN